MLELQSVSASYGNIEALHGVSLRVERGSATSVLGANGAGKTTIMRVITGLLRGTGSISFECREMLGMSPDRILRLGIAMVPESRELFTDMSVEENLRLGAYARSDARTIQQDIESALNSFPRLRERYDQIAGTLSGGEQQMLTIARALMSRPKLLILDEPSLGLAPKLVDEIFGIIRKIKATGISILLVEQNARMALEVSDFGYLLETGKVVMAGTAAELKANRSIEEAYL